jgi:hypothetical protein
MGKPIIISGIQCDGCTWRDDSIKYEEYHKYVDKLCSNCGSKLLTQSEFKRSKQIMFISNLIYMFRFINPLFYLNLLFKDVIKDEYYEFKLPRRDKDAQ